MNKCFLSGIVSSEVTLSATNSNICALSFDMKVVESWIDRNAKACERVSFFKCIQYGKAAEETHRKIFLGDYVIVEGSILVTLLSEGKFRHEIKLTSVEKIKGD